MPANLPVRAAGRTLTVGELREALEGLSDNDPVALNDGVITEAAPRTGGLLLTGSAQIKTDMSIHDLADSVEGLREQVKSVARGFPRSAA